jgi:hypothetical protein
VARDIVDPTVDEKGREYHPAWALIGAHRVSHGGGAVLFDSDIRHEHYVTVRISTASRMRDLNRDWLLSEREFVEVAMSEAQWASFVSSMNSGQGVPCTLTRREDELNVPGMPYEPRLQQSMAEVRGAADKTIAAIREAFDTYAAHKTVGNLRSLQYAIENATPNVMFAAKSLTEHAENVVQRAKADIEAMVVHKARQLGIEPTELGTHELTAGDGEETSV